MNDPYKQAGAIRRSLHTIREHYEGALNGAAAIDESDIHASTAAGEPVNLAAIDARAGAMRDLTYWVRFILDEVNDGTITHGPRDVEVGTLAAFVDIWALAVCEQCPLDGDNLDREMTRHAKLLEALAKGWQRKRIEIGRCPERIIVIVDDYETFVACTGTLHAIQDENDEGLLPANVICDSSREHQWSPWQWRELGHRLGTTA